MKYTVYFVMIILFLAGCDDDYYMEGYIKTVGVTEITEQSAVLNGEMEITTVGKEAQPNIVSRGFILQTLGMSDRTVKDNLGREGGFRLEVGDLGSNTKYRVKAFVTIEYNYDYNSSYYKKTDTFYGSIIEFTTQ